MEIIGNDPIILGQKNDVRERDLISRDTYRRIKNYDRQKLSGYLKNLYRKAWAEGVKLGVSQGEKNAEKKHAEAQKARDPQNDQYQPFTCWGKVSGTGTPIDGHTLLLTLWSWDKYEEFHLSGTKEGDDEADAAVMAAMHDADEVYNDMPLEEFRELWKNGDYDAPGVYAIPLAAVQIEKIVCMEAYLERVEPAETEAAHETEQAGE